MISKGWTDLAAVGTDEGGLDLRVEQIDDDRVVAFLVVAPHPDGTLAVGHLLDLGVFRNVWLLGNAVAVLVQPVQHESNELLRVVLLVSTELRRKLRDDGLDVVGRNARRGHLHFVQKRGEGTSKLATTANGIVCVEITDVFAIKEELCQQLRVDETLQP